MGLTKIEIENLRDNFRKIMAESGWGLFMEDFAKSTMFNTLMQNLRAKDLGEGITPDIKSVFRAFRECPLHELKVVIIGQDPYPKHGVADGLAFSCSITKKEQPSLKVIFNEIERTVYPNSTYDRNPDLSRWAKQGVLLLNTALTTKPGKIGAHYTIWKPFTEYVIAKFNEDLWKNIIFVAMGNEAKKWIADTKDDHYKLDCYHPASAVYSGGKWKSNNIFNKINSILNENYEKITW